MPLQSNPYTLVLFVMAGVSAWLALIVWRCRRTAETTTGVLFLAAVAAWQVGYALELAATGLPAKEFWFAEQYLGIATLPTLWLFFAIQYSGRSAWLKPGSLWPFLVEPTTTLALAITNGESGLLWQGLGLDTSGELPVVVANRGPFFAFHVLYSHVLLLAGAVLVLQVLARSHRIYHRQIHALLAAGAAPWLANVLYLTGMTPPHSVDLTPFAFGLTGLMVAFNITHNRFLELMPVARDGVIEALRDGLMILDRTGRVLDMNSAAEVLLGGAKLPVVGQPAVEALGRWPELVRAIQAPRESRVEFTVSNGKEPTFLEARLTPLSETQQPPKGCLIFLHDIGERKKAEQALRESETRYRNLVEYGPDAIAVHSEGRFLFLNQSAARMLGAASPDQLVGKPIMDVVHPDSRELAARRIAAVLTDGRPAAVTEEKFIRADGQVVEAEVAAVPFPYEGQAAVQTVARDITERKRAERDRAALLDAIPDLMFRLSREGMFLDFHAPSEQDLLVPPRRILGSRLAEVLPPELAALTQAKITRTLESGVMQVYEYDTVARGSHQHWEARMVVCAPDQVMSTVRNVTDRKWAEAALRRNEAYFRALIENAQEAIAVLNADGVIWYASPAAEQILGYRVPEMVGTSAFDLVPPDDSTRVRAAFEDALRNHGSRNVLTFQVRHLDGGCRTVEAIATNLISNPAVVGVVLNFRDVTARREAEEAERAQREWAEALRDTLSTLSRTLDYDEVLDRVLENIGRVLPHASANIMLLQEGMLCIARARGYGEPGRAAPVPKWSCPLANSPILKESYDTRRPVLVTDTRNYPGGVQGPQMERVRSYVAAPILVQGRVTGFLNLEHLLPDFYTPIHADRLGAFASHVAIALENARLLGQAEQRAHQMALLYDAGLALNSVLDPQALLEFLIQITARALHAERAEFFRFNPDRDELALSVAIGYAGHFSSLAQERLRFCLNAPLGIVGEVAAQRTPLYLPDVQSDPRWVLIDPEIRSGLWAPVERERELLGVLAVLSTRRNAFTAEHERLLILFANQAALALHNARQFETVQAQLQERQRIEQALQESEALYRDLVDNAPDLIQSVTPEGRYLYVNRAWRETLGYTDADLERLSVFDVIDPSCHGHCRQVLADVLAGNRAERVETMFVARDGRRVPVEGSIVSRAEDGRPVATRGIFRRSVGPDELQTLPTHEFCVESEASPLRGSSRAG